MKITKRIICTLLTIVLMITTFIVNGNTAEAKEKNTEYSCYTYEVKSIKKSKDKLTVKCRKNGLMAYIPDACERVEGTRKITYKIAKNCKWRYVDNDEKTKKTSYKSIKKRIKWDSGDSGNPNMIYIKVKKGKIVKITVYRYYG